MSELALPSDTHRVELVSMDPHFHGISIALYQRRAEDGTAEFLVYSFSSKTGATKRVLFAATAMRTLGGMLSSTQDPRFLRFDCGREHLLACKHLFLEACKIEPDAPLEPRPMSTFDKRSESTIDIISEDDGRYRVTGQEGAERRVAVAAGGLVKLTDMEALDDSMDRVGFDCHCSHDELVGLLLPRALNVRTVMREIELATARGVLSAPSGQE